MTPIDRMELILALREDRELRAAVTEAVMQTVAQQIENRKARRAQAAGLAAGVDLHSDGVDPSTGSGQAPDAAAAAHGATEADLADRQPPPPPPQDEPDPFADDDVVELTDMGREAVA